MRACTAVEFLCAPLTDVRGGGTKDYNLGVGSLHTHANAHFRLPTASNLLLIPM